MEPRTTSHASNRLIHEKSPYLQQHAYNPVDWYPWGEEAFEKAKRENRPIFLSIGYSTCHWCHVMAHESFEDDETGSRWDVLGRARSGPLEGTQLDAVEHLDTFWFAWAAFSPDTELVS